MVKDGNCWDPRAYGVDDGPKARKFCVIDLPDPVANAEGVYEFGPETAIHVVLAEGPREAMETRGRYANVECLACYEVADEVACGRHEARPPEKKACCGG